MAYASDGIPGTPIGERRGGVPKRTSLAVAAIAFCVTLLSCGCGSGSHPSRLATVKTGLDVLSGQGYRLLRGRRVGLICNHSTVNSHGQHIISLFRTQDAFDLVSLFCPEHGLKGDVEAVVPSSVHSETGLKVYSLYGETRRPTEESLKGIDTLVFDIQDIGARFYTYISTLAMCMEEAAKHELRFVVLDRPNPITGLRVEGPVLHKSYERSFISYFPLPVAHGMTVGELARLYNRAFGIGCDLRVVKMQGWRRGMWFDETGLPWIDPSPNIRNLTAATLYPGFCLVERTNMSVGRGTLAPFELYGAPWIDGEELARRMNDIGLPGLQFAPVEFTPDRSVFAGQRCSGVRIVVTDRRKLDCVRAGLTFVETIYGIHRDTFDIERMGPMIGDPDVADKIKAGVSVEGIARDWLPRLRGFMRTRKRYLLYS